ncbi:MAG: hypothetical protein HY560_06195 [Gemmatimonadetes bacterium]|nr:hypothetical protein [Gemmatimonadota bacterium]
MRRNTGRLLALVVLAACGPDVGPTTSLQVRNDADDFAFIAQTFDRTVNDSLVYTWQHTGTLAEVTQDTRVTAGTATLTIRDAAGAQVYNRSLAESGTFATAVGSAGNWGVEVVFKGLVGDIVFELKKGQ